MNIWSGSDKLINSAYCQDNYRIIDISEKNDLCLIFFSSHDIYYPNTEVEFIKTVLIKDRYEWINTASDEQIVKQIGRIIFVRDIYKQYYVTGINNSCSTITKTIELLRKKTEGYHIITFGSSAGGYMAMVAGIALGAQYIVNNSGDFDISDKLYLEYPFIRQAYEDEENECFVDLRRQLQENQIPIYYFMAGKNKNESAQYEYVKDVACIRRVSFAEKNHAATVFPGNWAYLILNQDRMESLYQSLNGKMTNKIYILFSTVPGKCARRIFLHECKEFLKRRLFFDSENKKI